MIEILFGKYTKTSQIIASLIFVLSNIVIINLWGDTIRKDLFSVPLYYGILSLILTISILGFTWISSYEKGHEKYNKLTFFLFSFIFIATATAIIVKYGYKPKYFFSIMSSTYLYIEFLVLCLVLIPSWIFFTLGAKNLEKQQNSVKT